MCGRFSLVYTKGFEKRFYLPEKNGLKPRFNIAPGQETLVIIKNNRRKLALMNWGLLPHWVKDSSKSYKSINARVESIDSKPYFRIPFLRQRCLVPASGFYEWEKIGRKEKKPHYIRLKEQDFFSMAGLFDVWEGKEGKINNFTIVTVEPNKLIGEIHGRMPAILDKQKEAVWLDENSQKQDLLSLLKPYDSSMMEAYAVSKRSLCGRDPRL